MKEEVFRKILEKPVSSLSVLGIISYVIGFVIWNSYLSSFGFFEYNVIQVRFLSAGLLFLLFLSIIVLCYLCIKILKPEHKLLKLALLILFVPLSIIGILKFKIIFERVPQYLGGGKPIPTTLIGTPEQIYYLNNFGIEGVENQADKESVQTEFVCLIYQNNDYILISNTETTPLPIPGIIRIQERVISLSRDSVVGFHSTKNREARDECNKLLSTKYR